ncbi:MAG: hypothetical protein R3A44_04870 [Caldilineaceae bacterium]
MPPNVAAPPSFWQRQRSAEVHLPSLAPIALPVMQFLTLTTCPSEWIHHDLYIFRDESVTFYVGQSDCAFARVWTHLHDGFKGRSLVGKFIRNNWPRAMRFTIELIRTDAPEFQPIQFNRDDAERILIVALRPCFNNTHNAAPTALPVHYASPNKTVVYPRNMGKMMREADHAFRREQSASTW